MNIFNTDWTDLNLKDEWKSTNQQKSSECIQIQYIFNFPIATSGQQKSNIQKKKSHDISEHHHTNAIDRTL